MRPTQVIIFGSPKGGTPIMTAAPSAAIDLPMRVLVAQDAAGGPPVTFNDHRWLAARYKLTEDQVRPLAGLPLLIEAALKSRRVPPAGRGLRRDPAAEAARRRGCNSPQGAAKPSSS